MKNSIQKLFNTQSKAIYLHQKTYLKERLTITSSYPLLWKKIFYKEYPRFPLYQLPIPTNLPHIDLYEALLTRNSSPSYKNKEIKLSKLSEVLYFSAGLKSVSSTKPIKRMYPSAGGRYPLEMYVLVLKPFNNLEPGIYHYNVKQHGLEQLSTHLTNSTVLECVPEVNKNVINTANAIIIITSVFSRTEIKYTESAYRFINLEAGHLAQNIVLICAGNKINSCLIGGFYDEKVNTLLDLEEEKEQGLYIVTIGSNTR